MNGATILRGGPALAHGWRPVILAHGALGICPLELMSILPMLPEVIAAVRALVRSS